MENERTAGDRETNVEIGRRLGLGDSGVSRIRSGERYPSLAVMRKIGMVYRWPLDEQLGLIPDAGRDGRYAEAFERRVRGDR